MPLQISLKRRREIANHPLFSEAGFGLAHPLVIRLESPAAPIHKSMLDLLAIIHNHPANRPCIFIDGECQRFRELKLGTPGHPRCCCQGCKGACGYTDVVREGSLDTLLNTWDPDRGFYSSGCALPREHRSITCLRYRCRLVEPDKLPADLLELHRQAGNHRSALSEHPYVLSKTKSGTIYIL